jgi:hypothetical protein
LYIPRHIGPDTTSPPEEIAMEQLSEVLNFYLWACQKVAEQLKVIHR